VLSNIQAAAQMAIAMSAGSLAVHGFDHDAREFAINKG
jgi:hypothetical protein